MKYFSWRNNYFQRITLVTVRRVWQGKRVMERAVVSPAITVIVYPKASFQAFNKESSSSTMLGIMTRQTPTMLQTTVAMSTQAIFSSTSKKAKIALKTVVVALHIVVPLLGGTIENDV